MQISRFGHKNIQPEFLLVIFNFGMKIATKTILMRAIKFKLMNK